MPTSTRLRNFLARAVAAPRALKAFGCGGGLAVVFLFAGTAGGQVNEPLVIPEGPGTPGFDISRLNSENFGSFEPFSVQETQPLLEALELGKVASDTRVLVTETATGPLALLTDQMAYHHLARGREGGKDWMATF